MAASPSLKRTFLLGRSSECDVVLQHPEVSGRHALLIVHPDGSIEVQDVGSKNGTFVNGERVMTKKIQHGDVLALGSYQLNWEEILLNPPAPVGGTDSPTRMTRVPTSGRGIARTLLLVLIAVVVVALLLYFFVRPWVFQSQ
ncbi:MAG: FHA domain-containing protein [Bacteroidia bacterium]|nr:FHA domain-containing protein [Bacteroidia bacterium]